MLLEQLKALTTLPPKRKPAPRGLKPQPSTVSSGSDHSSSHMAPSWGTSCFLKIVRICHAGAAYVNIIHILRPKKGVWGLNYQTWSNVEIEGDRPP